MSRALAAHDALARDAVERRRGTVVKMTGDGMYATFSDPVDALHAAMCLQAAIADPAATEDVALRVRCAVHAGVVEGRDDDFFGRPVNRAARIMGAAHGGQVLLSQAVAVLVGDRLPAGAGLRDLGSVRLRDLAIPEHVYQLTHLQLQQNFPALRSLEATPNNLPQQVTSFIGREFELAEVGRLLGKSRLVTLLGVGGLGKTRLSLEAAADAMDDYPDGIWLVELAPLTDARLVAQAVASALGVKEEAGRPVREALLQFVGDRQLLLILDSCEHLLQPCAELARQLMQAGPPLKILATSREPLHVAGETTYQLPSLSVPDAQDQWEISVLAQYEAIRLFIDRAVAAQPAFHLTDQNATAVANICRRLDGIPLAIELAAARVRALAVKQIDARLSDRFRLLTGGDRTALARQQTLRACIDWSYDLLTEPERRLLRRLAVFSGGWTLDAAEAVGAGGDAEAAGVLELLTHLVEKSLVVPSAEGERYWLLDTVRQYARERLDESSDGSEARARHLQFYVALVETARSELLGPEQGAWHARLDLERENLLAANAWCDHAEGGGELGLRLAYGVPRYWENSGLLELGYRLTEEALSRAGAQVHGVSRCRALHAAALLCYWMGRYQASQRYSEESVALAREIGGNDRIGAALTLLGMVCHGAGDLAAARRHNEEALRLAREFGQTPRLADILNALAELHRAEGHPELAEPLYEESLELNRLQGDPGDIAGILLNLAMVSIDRRSGERAKARLREALAIVEDLGISYLGWAMLDISAGLAAFLGDSPRAARFFGASEEKRVRMARQRERVDDAFLRPLIAKAREVMGEAAFAPAEHSGRALTYEDALCETRAWLESRSDRWQR